MNWEGEGWSRSALPRKGRPGRGTGPSWPQTEWDAGTPFGINPTPGLTWPGPAASSHSSSLTPTPGFGRGVRDTQQGLSGWQPMDTWSLIWQLLSWGKMSSAHSLVLFLMPWCCFPTENVSKM